MNEQKPPLLLSNYFVEKLNYEALPGFDPAAPGAEEMVVDPDVYPVPDKPGMFMVRLHVALAGPPKSNSRCRLDFAETTANGPYGKVILGTVNFTEIFRRKAAALPKPASAEFSVSDKPASRPRRRIDRV
jgi:hypothetical protein